MRTRPGRSVTNSRPSGAKAIAQGTCSPVATVSTRKRMPSSVLNVSGDGPGDGDGDGAGDGEGGGAGDGSGERQARVSTVCAAKKSASRPTTAGVHMTARPSIVLLFSSNQDIGGHSGVQSPNFASAKPRPRNSACLALLHVTGVYVGARGVEMRWWRGHPAERL